MSAAAIEQAILAAGLEPLTPRALEQFEAYLALLLKWNARVNLTAIREPEGIIRRHFVECIQFAQNLPALPEGAALLDYGSGAGLPGIPVAICRPELRVTLAESQQKKATFLREAARSLGLNIEIFNGRVENMPPDRIFSVVTLRAVDKMIQACRTALSRVATEGWMVPFATQSTATAIKTALPGVDWFSDLPLRGSDQALVLFGKWSR